MTKDVGDGQLSDPRVQVTDRVFSNIRRRSRLATAFEDVGGLLRQCLFPLMDHRRMNALFGGQFRYRALSLLGAQNHPHLERRVVVPAFQHVRISRISSCLEISRLQVVASVTARYKDILAIELQALIHFDFEVELTGFELAEIDLILDEDRARRSDAGPEAADVVPPISTRPAVTKRGDVWQLGAHRLICGDARDPEALATLLVGEEVDLIFTDPPYNVAVDGHVGGLGKVKHREFAFASGEMRSSEFTTFLREALVPAEARCCKGAIAYVCMDWRHMREMIAAGDAVFHELKNLFVWNKSNGGMGSFYRSKYELVFVWKVRLGRLINSFGLGDTRRYRTNVWDYAGINSFGASRDADLAMHSTVKPVALIGDTILDCSKRGNIVLDMFGGSGSTLIAAQETGRRARLIEYDPAYCDVIIARWEKLTGRASKRVTWTAKGKGIS